MREKAGQNNSDYWHFSRSVDDEHMISDIIVSGDGTRQKMTNFLSIVL